MKKTENEQLIDRVYDLINQSQKQNRAKFSHFLNEKECYIAEKIAKTDNCIFYGGYDNAKRKMLGVFSEFKDSYADEFPFECIKIEWRAKDEVGHRDILGSIMGLGIKRSAIGDIVLEDNFAYVFAEDTVSDHILSQITKIGKVGVKLLKISNPEINYKENYIDINASVSSFRIDAMVASAINLSRSKAQSLIMSKGIVLNYDEIHDINKQMKPGDIFSIQGYGKFVFSQVGKNTKSGRIHIVIKKYQ